jgi:hypothetical protein
MHRSVQLELETQSHRLDEVNRRFRFRRFPFLRFPSPIGRFMFTAVGQVDALFPLSTLRLDAMSTLQAISEGDLLRIWQKESLMNGHLEIHWQSVYERVWVCWCDFLSDWKPAPHSGLHRWELGLSLGGRYQVTDLDTNLELGSFFRRNSDNLPSDLGGSQRIIQRSRAFITTLLSPLSLNDS